MGEVRWDLLAAYPNPGEAFAKGWQEGEVKAKEAATKRAIAALLGNPRDANAMATVALENPEFAYTVQKGNKADDAQRMEEFYKVAAPLAAQVQTPEEWDALADDLVANGYPMAAQFKGQFSPAMRSRAMALGGVTEKPLSERYIPLNEGGGLARINPKTGQAEMVILPNQGGAPVGSPVAGGPPPAAVDFLRNNPQTAAQFEMKYGPGSAARVLGNGGPTPDASGPFPGPGY